MSRMPQVNWVELARQFKHAMAKGHVG